MQKIFTNHEKSSDGILNDFLNLQATESDSVRIATAYFGYDGLTSRHFKNSDVKLIVGFNEILNIDSLRKVYEASNISVKFYTKRFHPKLYLFDNGVVVVGSSNYTNPGIGIKNVNSECNIATNNRQTYKEVSRYFDSLWGEASIFKKEHFGRLDVLQKDVKKFEVAREKVIEDVLPSVDPLYRSESKITRTFVAYDTFLENFEDLSKMYFETLEPEIKLPESIEVDIFLNWLCNVHDDLEQGEIVNKNKRDKRVRKYLKEFGSTGNGDARDSDFGKAKKRHITIKPLLRKQNIRKLDKESLELIVKNVYSFERFYPQFINMNHIEDVIDTFYYLLFSNEDIRLRLHNVLDGDYKLEQFQASRALELLGRADVGYPIWTEKISKSMAILGYSDFVDTKTIVK